MSTFKVSIERLEVIPHPNADRLELAQVGLYRAVVPKGEYQTGDYAVYIPEQAVLPFSLIEELGLVGRLAGKDKNRVKAVRLRGEVSQGIVCRPEALETMLDPEYGPSTADFSEDLGISKWVPQIPPHMNGQVIPAPELMRWVDIENLQRYPNVFSPGEMVIATEKIHGTCLLATYDFESRELWVSSKGYGSRNQALKEDPNNLYWRAVEGYDLKGALDDLCYETDSFQAAIFGEVFGKGVQDLHYGASTDNGQLGFRAFDIKLRPTEGSEYWVPACEFEAYCLELGVPTAPQLYHGPFDLDLLRELATGKTELGADHIREGLVIRPVRESYSDVLGGRKIAKLISPDYLLRKGETTEFE